ncbi:hypothetical protein FIBSPDRAFT_965430 [Athelia psychrophila]|uniref:Uncharacterized protein n=1 Tax=Athelia psychrophila TaxID=1759441 RepID=A0A165WL32_9AGAM|nr:hypothetical protein FIBSPDRAFT_965430 [Fibularhizoctonia sp. CBS 109695]
MLLKYGLPENHSICASFATNLAASSFLANFQATIARHKAHAKIRSGAIKAAGNTPSDLERQTRLAILTRSSDENGIHASWPMETVPRPQSEGHFPLSSWIEVETKERVRLMRTEDLATVLSYYRTVAIQDRHTALNIHQQGADTPRGSRM